jgi:hypothetical protein
VRNTTSLNHKAASARSMERQGNQCIRESAREHMESTLSKALKFRPEHNSRIQTVARKKYEMSECASVPYLRMK